MNAVDALRIPVIQKHLARAREQMDLVSTTAPWSAEQYDARQMWFGSVVVVMGEIRKLKASDANYELPSDMAAAFWVVCL